MVGRVGLVRRMGASLVLAASVVGTVPAADPPSAESIEELVVRVGRTRWTTDNSVELLDDPRLAWRARVELVENARHHILISAFSWYNDEHGTAFRELLATAIDERRSEGSELTVRVLADASTLGMFSPAFGALERNGARVRGFNRSSWGLSPIYDGRMHDKVLVADGRTAIISGRNFADIYFDTRLWWLDLGVRLRGSAVDDVQMNFLKSWELTDFNRKAGRFLLPQEMLLDELRVFWRTGRYPNGRSPLEKFMNTDYFPPRDEPPGAIPVAVLYDNSLLRRRAATTDLAIALVGRAERQVDLMTPFPNFTDDLTDALAAAAARGVKVRLVTNGRDTALRGGPFLYSGYPTVMRLIESGVEVWAWRANKDTIEAIEASGCSPVLMPPVALHGKMLRVDDEISIVHSSNFNIRSTYYNTEAGVVVLDRDFNRLLGELVDGLVSLRDFELDCRNGERGFVEQIVERLGVDDLPWMREDLGRKQRLLDAYSVAW